MRNFGRITGDWFTLVLSSSTPKPSASLPTLLEVAHWGFRGRKQIKAQLAFHYEKILSASSARSEK